MRSDRQGRAIALACVAGIGHFLAVYMVQPLLGLYATTLGADPVLVGAIMSSFGFLPMFLAVPVGMLVDRVDVRRLVVAGAASSVLALLTLSAVPHYAGIIAAQTVLGVAHVVTLIATQNYVATISSPAARDANFGYLGSGTSAGMTVAPALGGALVVLASARGLTLGGGYRLAFAVAAAACLAPLLAGVFLPPAPPRRRSATASGSVLVMARQPGMQVVILATFIHIASLSGRTSFYPLFLNGMGYSPARIGLLFTVHSAASLAVRPFLGAIVRVFRRERLFLGCMALMVAAWIAIPFSPHPAFQAANMLVAGVSAGLLHPLILVMVTSCCAEDKRGLGMGLRFAVNRLATVVAPMLIGLTVARAGMARAFQLCGIPLVLGVAAAAVLMTGRLPTAVSASRST